MSTPTPYEEFKDMVPVCDVSATDPDNVELPAYTAVSIGDITTGDVDGTGMFDLLMKAFNNHIQIEWGKSRLRGTEYSEVYLGGMQACLQAAMEFALNKDKTNLEIIALRKMTFKAAWEVELIKAQVCKTRAEYDGIIASITKTLAEKLLIDQKKETELAQVNPAGVDDGSVIDAQIKLYQQQTKGFKRNAEQQAAKIMTDYSTAALVQGSAGFSPDTSGFRSDEIKAIIEKLAEGLDDNI